MKRSFRPERSAAVSARYPIHVEGRRVFLQQLGLVIGGGVLASALPGCGDEEVGPVDTLGIPPDVAAPVDVRPDAGPVADTIAPGDLEPFVDQGVPQDVQTPGDVGPDLTEDERG